MFFLMLFYILPISPGPYAPVLTKFKHIVLFPSKYCVLLICGRHDITEPIYSQGISAHVDLMRFEDGIAIVSLESSCVMHFTRVEQAYCDIPNGGNMDPPMTKIPVYLNPGSLILMSKEARYRWKHEINRRPGFQIWEGHELNQTRRISVTLRKLCKDE